ncbi:hypothetical protein PLESTF_001265000 [Pleodorina starrii]|nr:hypothetical protein PLESTF_001265000 [Pleodorina starrii]
MPTSTTIQELPSSQPQPSTAAAVQQTAVMFRVPGCLRLPMMNLGRVIDNAVDLAESLLATDFTADYLIAAPARTQQHPAAATPNPAPSPAPAEPGPRTATATPSRTGAAVQAARAVCEKLSCALAATEAARLSTHLANLKLTNTPPQLRYPPPQQQGGGRCGNLTSRELRFCVEASPVRSSACFPLGSSSGTSLLTISSPGFATARGPRPMPLPVAAPAAARPSPLRPPPTARPSRPTGVPALMLQETSGPAAAAAAHQQQQQQQVSVHLSQSQPLPQHQPQQQQQQQRGVVGGRAAAGAGTQQPAVPRFTISLPHRIQAAAAAAATDPADVECGSPTSDCPMPLGSPFSPSSAQPAPVLITSSSPSPPFTRRLGGPAPAVQSGTPPPPPATTIKSPPKPAPAAVATGVTRPCDPPAAPARANPIAVKPAAAATAAAMAPGKGMPPRPVPVLRLPLQEGAATAAGPLLSSRLSRNGMYTGRRGGSEDGAVLGAGGGAMRIGAGLGLQGLGGEEGAARAAAPRPPVVPGLRLGAVAR